MTNDLDTAETARHRPSPGRDALSRLRDRRKARRAAVRDPYWENVRYVAATLVVFVHVTGTVSDRDGLLWLYIATWALRVPLFALVAGYFSTADALTPRRARRLIEAVLVPYLLVGLLHTLQLRYFRGEWGLTDGAWTFFTVHSAWGLWFLLSLLFWRLGLPLLAQLRYPLAASVAIALVSGYVSDIGSAFSFARTLTYLPFFLLGWKLRQGLLADALRAGWARWAGLGTLAVVFAASWFGRGEVRMGWLLMKGAYIEGNLVQAPLAWVPRAGVLLGGMLVILAFLPLVPRRRLPLVTSLGTAGLYIYLLHPLALRPLLERYGFDWVGPWYEQVALVLFAVVLAAALGSPPVRWLTRPVIEPRLPWLFRGDPGPGREPGAGAGAMAGNGNGNGNGEEHGTGSGSAGVAEEPVREPAAAHRSP